MYTKILVPLDGSKVAEAVLPYARSLAENLKIPVELMTVIDTVAIGRQLGTEHYMHFDAVIRDQAQSAEQYLNSLVGTFDKANVSYSVEKGISAGSILSKADADKGTLIAMATHGRSGLTRWMLGSIAEKVLRAANNPLLLVRATKAAETDGKATLDSVMVPLDGSALAESVLPYAIELAKALNLKLRLIRSYHTTGMLFYYEDYVPSLERVLDTSKFEAMTYLDEKVDHLKYERLSDVSSFVAEGEPAEEILDAAKGAPNTLVAMCTHGRSGVNRWMLGSVTEKVVRHSGNPLLVIRAT
ncbi:MAG TPA: universal stress protein [Terriglobales bacterium]|nr:universal stress protein [Terriglobales bacterium]